MPRILFVAAHRPDRSPSQRYRFEQFAGYWAEKGFTHEYAWLIGAEDDQAFYSPGRLAAKAGIFIRSWNRRAQQVRRARDFDLIIVQREAFMTGSTRFEERLAASGVPVIYDFDDAIWHMDVSDANRKLRWLKDPGKTAKIIGLADLVIAGNNYLADYAKGHNTRVEVVPTVIDTDRYVPTEPVPRADGKVVIGWTGSYTSLGHLKPALPMLRRLYDRFGERIIFRVISDRDLVAAGLPVENIRWKSSTEAQDLAGIDIGIMPLPDDEWSRGKCGFKGLQYMGMGKAVVLGRVGVNNEIVQDGWNGMLSGSEAEWLQALGDLVESADLRARLGAEARRTVVERYSVRAWRDKYLDLFNELINGRPKR
ncbi:MAG: glycosyltransferase family 4 protein [Flavobacteriales bacterium]|nr:glycosyltransferase family 4 protein [Flavobacteriales bacterium]